MEILIDIIRNLGPLITISGTPDSVRDNASNTINKCLNLINKQLDHIERQTSDIKVVKIIQ